MIVELLKVKLPECQLIQVIKICRRLVREEEFIYKFILVGFEHLLEIISKEKQEEQIYIESFNLLNEVIEILITDKYFIFNIITESKKLNSLVKLHIHKSKESNLFATKLSETIYNLSRLIYHCYQESLTGFSHYRDEISSFYKYLILDFHQNTLFTLMLNGIHESSEELKMIKVKTFDILAKIDVVYLESYFSEDDILVLTEMIFAENTSMLRKKVLRFVTRYTINNLTFVKADWSTLSYLKVIDKAEVDMFSLFFNGNFELRFLISLMILCFSVIRSFFHKSKYNLLPFVVDYIKSEIKSTYRKPFDRENEDTKLKLSMIDFLIEVLEFLTSNKSLLKVQHIEMFSLLLDITTMLYEIQYPDHILRILKILDVLSCFTEIKMRLSTNKKFLERVRTGVGLVFESLKNTIEKSRQTSQVLMVHESVSFKNQNSSSEKLDYIRNIISTLDGIILRKIDFLNYSVSIIGSLLVSDKIKQIKDEVLTADFLKLLTEILSVFEENISLKNKQLVKLFENKEKLLQQIRLINMMIKPKYAYTPDISGKINKDRRKYLQSERESINFLVSLIGDFKTDFNLTYKFIFAINRYLFTFDNLAHYNDSLTFLVQECRILYEAMPLIFVSKQITRLLLILISFPDNKILSLTFEDDKITMDRSGFNDVLLKHKNSKVMYSTKVNRNFRTSHKVLLNKEKQVTLFSRKRGHLFDGDFFLAIPKSLPLEGNFYISFRYYNCPIKTNQFKVLLQDDSGSGGLVIVSPDGLRLGTFSKDGNFVDSCIDLSNAQLMNRWIHVTINYVNKLDSVKLQYFLNGEMSKEYMYDKVYFPENIMYIGNSKDFNEPFGLVADLNIMRACSSAEFDPSSMIESYFIKRFQIS